MNFSRLLFFVTIVIITFSSCEKEINMSLVSSEPKLVVEGSIATDQQPIVVLTKTVGFFDKIDVSKINFVKNASVWVKDLNTNKKIELKVDTSLAFVAFYTIQQNDPLFVEFEKGIEGHSYQLDITLDNQQFTSVATMPNNPGFDSLYFEPEKNFNDTLFILKARLTDPDTIGNCYKYFTKCIGVAHQDTEFQESFSSRFDDIYFNGKSVPQLLFLGYQESEKPREHFDAGLPYSNRGDSIQVKLSVMDKNAYDFWKTLDFAEGSVGNPFAAPIQVQSNISNNAFGVWTAFSNKYYSIKNNK